MPRPKGGYRNAAGQRIPGVTTVIKQIGWSGDALVGGAFKAGRENPDARSVWEVWGKASDIGTAVHFGVERSLSGDSDGAAIVAALDKLGQGDEGEAPDKVRSAMQQFLNWRKVYSFTPLEQEISIVSELHQCGSTLDCVGTTPLGLTLFDWKRTGGIYRETLLQIEAYRRFWNEANPDRQLDGGLHVLRLTDSGWDMRWWQSLEEWWPPFLLARKLYDYDKRLKI